VPGVLIKLFGAKMLLVAAYVVIVMSLLPGARVLFVASFTVQYVLLHVMEAFFLRRLFDGRSARASA
jgi:hypothetical protein